VTDDRIPAEANEADTPAEAADRADFGSPTPAEAADEAGLDDGDADDEDEAAAEDQGASR
jgi:hypothetical protein